MEAQEIRDLSKEDLESKIEDQREELFKLRFQISVGQVVDTSRLRKTRLDLARLLTEQRAREIAGHFQAAEAQ
ncbi:MAG: 50S ribosomal protein L29 [Anaerolineales bacterium]